MRPEVSKAERMGEASLPPADASHRDRRDEKEITEHADLRASDYIPGEIAAKLVADPVDQDTKTNRDQRR
jgi:hypothetical protein